MNKEYLYTLIVSPILLWSVPDINFSPAPESILKQLAKLTQLI